MMFIMKSVPIKELSAVQQEQTGNNCAIFSACAALQLLFGLSIDPYHWSEKVDALPFPAIMKMRMMRNGPVTPDQHLHLIHWIAKENGISTIMCYRSSATKEVLLHELQMPNTVQFVTLGWWFSKPPEITFGRSSVNQNASTARVGFHTMILAAYDPNHIGQDGLQRPWGFINSWKSSASDLYWMQDSEFQRGWDIYTPFNGRRSLVTLVRIS
jgi:hypothetical protein